MTTPTGWQPIEQSAVISECGLYRYVLTRRWAAGSSCLFVMLNPSTADARHDDATIRRCIGFAKSWGHGRLVVCNLFAFRATDPRHMKAAADPVGPENDRSLARAAKDCAIVICAWGAHGKFNGRDSHVINLLADSGLEPMALGITKDGSPKHPLYLPRTLSPAPLYDLWGIAA